jgi:hypothetical protein
MESKTVGNSAVTEGERRAGHLSTRRTMELLGYTNPQSVRNLKLDGKLRWRRLANGTLEFNLDDVLELVEKRRAGNEPSSILPEDSPNVNGTTVHLEETGAAR